MANVRDSDTSLWLHNKLGTSNDSWTGGSICSQLNSEVLRNVKECFPDLQTQVKLKLLLSFFQIPHRNIQEWRVELEEILEIAQADSDRWVSVMAEILRNFPTAYTLNVESFEVKENKRIFDDLMHDLKKQLKKPTDFNMLPLECHYLNRSALINVIGQPPVPKKHFTLKRKPKSAAVKADLVQKSTDLSNNMKKNISPAVPVRSRGMPRKMTDTTPMKGIPSRLPSGGFKTSILSSNNNRPSATRPLSGRKDCAIKLLDITEQPIGYAQAKKRKRMQEMEESKRNADELSNSVGENSSSDLNSSQNGDVQSSAAPATPHYAAGLTALNKPTPAIVPAESKSPPHASTTPLQPPSTPYSQTYFQSSPTHTPQTPQTPQTPMYTPVIMESSAVKDEKSTANANTTQKQQTSKQQQQTPKAQQQIAQTQPQPAKTVTAAVTATKTAGPQKKLTVTPDSPYLPKNAAQINIQPELLQEAIERFKTANAVTPPEKVLILSFMAGSRENPCPQLGSVMTIKLSENKVSVQQPNGTVKTMSVEMHFQMNYNTGEWSWIEKKREIDTSPLSSLAAAAAAAANNESFPQQQLAS